MGRLGVDGCCCHLLFSLGEQSRIDHLVFVVHGIGAHHDLNFRCLVDCGKNQLSPKKHTPFSPSLCPSLPPSLPPFLPISPPLPSLSPSPSPLALPSVDDFREVAQLMLHTHRFAAQAPMEGDNGGRVEFLPVHWHMALHGDDLGVDQHLKPLTLKSISRLREFTNSTLLDILFFTSPIYCQVLGRGEGVLGEGGGRVCLVPFAQPISSLFFTASCGSYLSFPPSSPRPSSTRWLGR